MGKITFPSDGWGCKSSTWYAYICYPPRPRTTHVRIWRLRSRQPARPNTTARPNPPSPPSHSTHEDVDFQDFSFSSHLPKPVAICRKSSKSRPSLQQCSLPDRGGDLRTFQNTSVMSYCYPPRKATRFRSQNVLRKKRNQLPFPMRRKQYASTVVFSLHTRAVSHRRSVL